MNTTAIIALILSIFNSLFILGYIYIWANGKCEECKEKLTTKEILTFKIKCKDCRDGKDKESRGKFKSFFSK